jgi:hypothetical protein
MNPVLARLPPRYLYVFICYIGTQAAVPVHVDLSHPNSITKFAWKSRSIPRVSSLLSSSQIFLTAVDCGTRLRMREGSSGERDTMSSIGDEVASICFFPRATSSFSLMQHKDDENIEAEMTICSKLALSSQYLFLRSAESRYMGMS